MNLDILNMVQHVQKTRIFTSKIHVVQHKFLSKAHIKQVFLKGLASASVRSTCSNAQVVVQDLQKNVSPCFNDSFVGSHVQKKN